MATIVLTGGGSAGHCIPHLSLLPYLKNDFDKIYYIGSQDGIEKNIIENTNIPYYSIPCAKLNRKFTIKNLKIPATLLSGIVASGKLLDKLKPDLIFSKGGYVSVPTVIAGKKRNIPIISHESDYSVGLANKITSKCCKAVLTSFPETAKEIHNGRYIGSPIRKMNTLDKNYSQFGFDGTKPVLLIVGGSLGAKKINQVVYQAINELLIDYDVIHVCGKGNLNNQLKLKGYYQVEFLKNIDSAFAIAKACVSRAGSNAVFELLSLKIPTLLIPLPKEASRGDQLLNASYFQKLGLVNVLYQENLTKESLVFNINNTYKSCELFQKNFNKHPVQSKSREISRILVDYLKK